jgi:GalNAc-alpha-(1->4)-GalNAc-alpha-(1->3)-diNAcBac-PP-undecaprenol alpha-1,4-N-acetyl-D-galactosaminyltransferase
MKDDRIRLLVVSHSLSGGGAERFASTLLTRLSRERFAPSLCLATDRVTYDLPDDVEVEVLGYGGLRNLPRAFLGLRAVIDRRRPDVVLSNVLSTNCLAGGALTSSRHRPAWVARVGNAPEKADPPLQRFWARRLYPKAQVVVTNSRGLEREFLREYPGVAGHTTTIPNPTDFERLDERAVAGGAGKGTGAGLEVLWVGRLVPQKRPELALDAFAGLRRSHPDARLALLGEGPLRDALQERVEELGLTGAVELPGFVGNPFARCVSADVFLLTSDHEGLPNALIEAQGLGLPAVSTRCPHGPDEIVEDGVTGRLVSCGDASGLAERLRELADDPEGRREMGEAARRLARRRFAVERVVPRWEETLIEAVRQGGPRTLDLRETT